MTRFRGLAAVTLILASLLALSACAYDPEKHSTQGVILVSEDDGIAKIPTGETLVLKYSEKCGKSTCSRYWHILAKGDGRLTVTNEQMFDSRVRDFAVTNHKKAEISTYWLADPLVASLDSDGQVVVDWPTGFWSSWTYQSYDPPQ